MDKQKLKESLQVMLGSDTEDQRAGEHLLEAFEKMESDGLSPYMMGVNSVISCCALLYQENNDRHDEFMDFLIKAANTGKEMNSQ